MTTLKRIRFRPLFRAFALCGLLAALGCQPIPTGPTDDGEGVSGLSYINEPWGFQISRPDTLWGIQVSTDNLNRAINGLANVSVRIFSPILSDFAGEFRPHFHLSPRALREITTLDSLVVNFEEQSLKPAFDQYRVIGEKQRVPLKGGEAMLWEFRYSQVERPGPYPGTRFLTAVALHNQVGFFMIGNGSREVGYPAEAYRQIVTSLEFR